jgi:hypothetical protein
MANTNKITVEIETEAAMWAEGTTYTKADIVKAYREHVDTESEPMDIQGFCEQVLKIRNESPANRTRRLFNEAQCRVECEAQLAPFAGTILADYHENDEHWQWVIDAPTDEIVAWAKAANR